MSGGLSVERLREAIYAVSVRHDWANKTDTTDRTEEIAAEYARLDAIPEDDPTTSPEPTEET